MKRVLVTGATGFIGFQSLPALVERGYDVVAVSLTGDQIAVQGVEWVKADLLDHSSVCDLMAKIRPSHLLHFSWYAVPGKFWNAQENFTWVQASLHLLQQFAACGGTRVVSAGTCAEYDWSHGLCIENETPLSPATPYGVCKSAMGAMQSAFCKLTDISQAWGRVFLLYGPREHPNRLVSSVICSLRKGEPTRCSHGNQIRDLMHVKDVAEAFVALLDSDVVGPVNIASGQQVALKEVIHRIADTLNMREFVQLGAIPSQANDPPLLVADTHRLTHEVGWSPHFDLSSGLDQTIRWWEEQDGIRR
jgi:nucleoside-diphosphate-sugar epimerase